MSAWPLPIQTTPPMPDTNKMLTGIAGWSSYAPRGLRETAIHRQLAPQAERYHRPARSASAHFPPPTSTSSYATEASRISFLAGLSTSGVVLSTVPRCCRSRLSGICSRRWNRRPRLPKFTTSSSRRSFPRQAYVITTAELAALLSTA